MVWIYYLLLLATSVVGLVLTAFMLPGLWLIVAAAAGYAYLTGGIYRGTLTLISLLVLAIVGEVGEFVLGGAGAKKAGASGWGVVGGIVGAIIGGIVLTPIIAIPVLGTIIGICIGSFMGAFGVEILMGKPMAHSARIGLGAARGRLTGIAGKITIGVIMLLLTMCLAIPIHGSKKTAPPATAPAVVLGSAV